LCIQPVDVLNDFVKGHCLASSAGLKGFIEFMVTITLQSFLVNRKGGLWNRTKLTPRYYDKKSQKRGDFWS
jgi:hypothetical protein